MNSVSWHMARAGTVALAGLVAVVGCDARSPLGPSATGAATTGTFLGSTQTPDQPNGKTLNDIREATARFQNIDVALASGYVDDGLGCIDALSFGLDASAGGMGFHLINWDLHDDPETDPNKPDLLVYQQASGNGKPKLVALEYENDRPAWFAAGHTGPPTLFGHPFESIDFEGLELFGLHLWLWRDNPAGMFEDFNPNVPLCR
jgi:hypothetical protein